MKRLRDAGGAFVDQFPIDNGRQVVVYIDPLTAAPAAFYVPATGCTWNGDELRLTLEEREIGVVRNGELHVSDVGDIEVSRPRQIFTRWYGFSFTFPGCSIYGEEA